MKDVITILATTLIILIIWITFETTQTANEIYVAKDLLEISLPINGTIDLEYLSTL